MLGRVILTLYFVYKSSLKSGKEAKLTSTVLYPQMWPHSFLCLTRAQREVKYEDLSIPEFVAGYAQILQQEISPIESTARLRHLVSLMYFAQQFTWSAVLSFHGAVLLEIERGFLIFCRTKHSNNLVVRTCRGRVFTAVQKVRPTNLQKNRERLEAGAVFSQKFPEAGTVHCPSPSQ